MKLIQRNIERRQGIFRDRAVLEAVRANGLEGSATLKRLLGQADRSVDARLQEIAGHLDDGGQIHEAMYGLELWRRALDGYRAARMGPAA